MSQGNFDAQKFKKQNKESQQFMLTPLQIIIMDCQFERLLLLGVYKNSKEFLENKDNFRKIMDYLNKTEIREEVLDLVLGLLKFFRFPLALCCTRLYHHIEGKSLEEQTEYKDRLLEIAAYVKSLVSGMQLTIFPEIQFFFKWGQAKKKYKVNFSPLELEFGKFIFELSQEKKDLQSLIDKELSAQEKQEKLNNFLGKTLESQNLFEQASIDHIKQSCTDIIRKIQGKKDVEPIAVEPQRPLKRRVEPKSLQKVEHVAEHHNVSKRNQSVEVSHVSNQSSFLKSVLQQSQSSFSQVKPICCHTFFIKDEVVDQPESLRIEYKNYNFPFYNNPDECPSKQEKIKRTICGFLNGEGGIIYFGIKEMAESRRRLVNGMVLTQTRKKQFTNKIMALANEVLPDVGKKCTLKYVPVKNSKQSYISGNYVAKVIIEQGAKNQVYSYLHSRNDGTKIEKFAFKTQNEVLEIYEIQRVLKIFKNKLESPERQYYPTHSYQCPQPEVGKPLYEKDYDYDLDGYEYEKPSKYRKQERKVQTKQEKQANSSSSLSDVEEQDFPTWQEQEEYLKKKKFMQKESTEFLVHLRVEEVEIFLRREGVRYKLTIPIEEEEDWTFLELERATDKSKLVLLPIEVEVVYSRVSYKPLHEDQLPIMDSIISEYRERWKTITKQTDDKIITFKKGINACKFYLKMKEMGLKVVFTPLI